MESDYRGVGMRVGERAEPGERIGRRGLAEAADRLRHPGVEILGIDGPSACKGLPRGDESADPLEREAVEQVRFEAACLGRPAQVGELRSGRVGP